MIEKQTYMTAAAIAVELSDRGIALTANGSTVLGDLLDASVSLDTVKTTMQASTLLSGQGSNRQGVTAFTAEVRADQAYYNTTGWGEQSQHDLRIEALADDLAPFVTQHISFARNTVLPIVIDLSEKMSNFVKTARPLDVSTQFEIRQCDLPEIVQDEAFLTGGLDVYNGKYTDYVPWPNALDVPDDPAYYAGLMNVGNERQNALINKWLRTLPEGFVKGIYIRVFAHDYMRDDGLRGCIMDDPGKYSNPYQTIDHALAIYIMGTKLMSDVPSVQGMTLTDYKVKMRDIIDYAGNMVINGITVAKRQIAGGSLVSEVNLLEKRIVVNKTMYAAWIEAGNRPEILLGMMASGNIQFNVGAIEREKDKMLSAWTTFVTMSQSTVEMELQRRFYQFAIAEAMNGLNDLTESEKEYFNGNVGHKEIVAKMMVEELDALGSEAMHDIYRTSLAMVAKARFYYTAAHLILGEMVEVSKQNENIDPREAALISAYSYLAQYFVGQISIQKV